MSTIAEELMRAPKLKARPSRRYFLARLAELRAMRKLRRPQPLNQEC